MPRSLAQRIALPLARRSAQLAYILAFGLRCYGRQNYPKQGGALVCANHQSHLDPVLVGLTCNRRMNYLARDSLFRFPLFRDLIRFMDAIPIEREGRGFGGIKEALRRLRRGELVLIFPEGTRSCDGRPSPLRPGFCALARRGRVPIVPVGFDGAFDAWPRKHPFPMPAVIHLCIGRPISRDTIDSLTDEQLVNTVQTRIHECYRTARQAKLASLMAAENHCTAMLRF